MPPIWEVAALIEVRGAFSKCQGQQNSIRNATRVPMGLSRESIGCQTIDEGWIESFM